MKVYGHKTSVMDRELIGVMKLVSCVVSTLVIGTKIASMVEVLSSTGMGIDTMDIGLTECRKVKAG